MLRTKCPNTYIPPTKKEIDAECNDSGVKQSAPDFVRDVCQIMAGGNLKTPGEMKMEIQKEVAGMGFPIKVGATHAGKLTYRSRTKLGTTGPTPKEVIDEDESRYLKHHMKVASMINHAVSRMEGVPGCTPLEKSINLLKLIQAEKPKEEKGSKKVGKVQPGEGEGEGQSTEDEMDALGEIDNPKETMEKIVEKLKAVDELGDAELDMMAGKDEKDEDPNNPALRQKRKAKKKMKVAEDMTPADKTILEVSRHLNEFSKLKSKVEIKFTPDLEGETVVYRQMQDLGELNRIRPAEWAMYTQSPNLFKFKALTGQLRVRERGNFTHYKQLLYMIIDASGSMGGERFYKAAGVLMNRLKAVVKGDAQLIWRLFDDNVYEEHYAKSVEDAYRDLAYMRDANNFHGGGTNFDVALTDAAVSIDRNIKEFGYIKPEIMIVTDGDGHTCMTKRDLKGCVVHAVCVCEAVNSSLKCLTKETGGIYTHC